ncbi:hypothetical protein OG866_18870 [Streptomyces sp. NBC_00663]|uniref:hypothetical protein n=1 Tax=Streptomyces sp. NBC_00663 TaxID=2975801 RepID=UPI002E336EAD|nr:hypothetical protein [Streptomyces sp. NBC_00663]
MDDELITERRPVAFPQVFGYLRHANPARHSALVSCLTEYCRRHELALCGVFIDRDTTAAIRSPAFVGLVDALELPDTYGAVTLALNHLGPKGLNAERRRRITAAGARLIVVRTSKPTTGAALACGSSSNLQRQADT